MAESFIFIIAGKLLAKISSPALKEIYLAWGLDNDLRKLEQNLITIKAVLLDAEEHQEQNQEMKLWLRRLKQVCYDADNVLDELEYHSLRKQVLKLYGNPIKNKVSCFFSSSNALALRFKIGHRIKELGERLDDIADHKTKFHLTELVDYRIVARQQREMTDSLLRNFNVIGREDDKDILLKFLLDTNAGDNSTVSVIPIVGMGGMGKTVFAKMLYNNVRVDDCFELKIWVCVSNEFDKKTLMVKMLKSLTDQNLSNLDPDQLQTIIQSELNAKKFLLVLDDVWSDDRYRWVEFVDLLEGGASGSKVIVTTRSSSVATIVSTAPAYHLKGLSHEVCLSVFKKWAFKEGEEESNPHLMKIGNDIVRKCGSLPLAVRTMGTLLYAKPDERYWKFIRDSELWKLEHKENDILPALRLSYDQMPSHLKHCFTSFSMYPKDAEMESQGIALFWMAHGFLQSSNDQEDMDDIARQYIREFHSRSFLQDFLEVGQDYVFTMHDLVHDLALSLAQTEYFILTVHSKNISDGIRHISISDKAFLDQKAPSFLRRENKIQTLTFPLYAEGPALKSFIHICISKCKFLRFLILRGCSLELLPSSIGNLMHMRYLDLSENTKLRKLPDSICKLHNLLVLMVAQCPELKELPRKIRNLVNLRVLEVSVKEKHLQDDGIWCLKSLRQLEINDCPEIWFEGIHNLTSLRELGVYDCKHLIALPQNLKYLTTLETLYIGGCDQLDWMEEEDNQEIKVSLESLTFQDLPQLETLPQWIQKYSKTLQRLRILNCVNFSSFPEWLKDFTTLKTLIIGECPTLSKRCQKDNGEDWYKIAHIPNIYAPDCVDYDEFMLMLKT